ncbi:MULTISPECIES: hypothetical protein [unclassified Desulfovibrio]
MREKLPKDGGTRQYSGYERKAGAAGQEFLHRGIKGAIAKKTGLLKAI